MKNIQKIKKVIIIALGFALSTYLLMSGFAMLEKPKKTLQEQNATIK
jgi:hypothetical protein